MLGVPLHSGSQPAAPVHHLLPWGRWTEWAGCAEWAGWTE